MRVADNWRYGITNEFCSTQNSFVLAKVSHNRISSVLTASHDIAASGRIGIKLDLVNVCLAVCFR